MSDDKIDLNELVIQLDILSLGEVIAVVANKFADMRGLEAPDFDSAEAKELALHTWKHVLHMHDRADFARSVKADLDKLESL